nr:tetratricopeptide repeat protein [Pontibacillus yanchengensis]
MVETSPDHAETNFYCAVSHDALGMEREAIPYYENALSNDIDGELREKTYVQLGSSFRCIGDYSHAKTTLEKGVEEFPDNSAIKAFLALTLHNLNEDENALTMLLNLLSTSSSDPWITKYKTALEFYSDNLEKNMVKAGEYGDEQ